MACDLIEIFIPQCVMRWAYVLLDPLLWLLFCFSSILRQLVIVTYSKALPVSSPSWSNHPVPLRC